MFNALSDRLEAVLGGLKSRGKLTEEQVDATLREIRLALLEADVNFKVVKTFVARVRERAVGTEVSGALNPGQQVTKIVHEELVRILGEQSAPLDLGSASPAVIMLAGLQGSGKTTAAGKLAAQLKKKGRTPLLAACDLQRPAAVDQLKVLGERAGVAVHAPEAGGDPSADPVAVARSSIDEARRLGAGVVIVDTAGRTNVDDAMMQQASDIREAVEPAETLFVIDAMIGQEAVTVAKAFQEAVDFTGVILSKLDGDARGGAALSVAEVTGRPIKFASVGEKLEEFEAFHPDRMAGRILGMGDVMTLIEKAEEAYTAEQAADLETKLSEDSFTLEDFLEQFQQIRKMGPLQNVLGMLPGVGKQLEDADVDESQLKRVEAIIQSMTRHERHRPDVLNARRKRRIAAGSGRTVQEVNELLKSYEQMRKMMKQMAGGRGGQEQALKQLQGAGAPGMGGGGMGGGMAGLDPNALAGLPGGGGGGGAPAKGHNKNVPKRKQKKKRKKR
ncbi:signal recognition particle protein [Egibacter rhizosphaerae]|uniref:Signal recognition particle protein n=1 Tax=Egibacter rhizosphaerae TaxID=1670831 RepID=A0A411YCT0_9ACTN|nr:signal recognition particle protein [Egibacter rhizosphaerae]QBI18975.1 signal recognition particle protein [Egibacter rhizosphaerae]